MNGLGSAREVLIIEALGDMAALLDRLEVVGPALTSTSEELLAASARLGVQAAAMEARMAALSEQAKVQVVKHVAKRTAELMHSAADAESRSMAAVARALLHAEHNPALQSLAQTAQACAVKNVSSRILWWSCVAAAASSAVFTWALTFIVLTK